MKTPSAFACLALLVATGCEREQSPNVLLLTLDTLRADRLGAYGYELAETPNLDRLAREGVVFDAAIAQAPLTLPSHATLFTGTFPYRHGVRDNGGYVLSDRLTTLAELAKSKGYRTGGFVSAFVLDSRWGLARGFDLYFDQFDLSRYERISLGSVERIAEVTVEEFLPWLERHTEGDGDTEAPFFAWVHLYDPHAPYDPPEPYASRFAERPYDGEVSYTDRAVGRVLDYLRARDLLESTVVMVLGDHGEGLGDHRELTHGNFVYDTTLRVPLLLRLPNGEGRGRRVAQQVGLVDVFPTVAELMSAPVPAQNQGQSLLPLVRGERLAESPLVLESFYPRLHYGWSEMVALRSGRYKLIDTPRAELYDLERDPGENENLAEVERELTASMREALNARLEEADAARALSPAPVDPETERRLQALGYVTGRAPDTDVSRHVLADPKDKVEVIQALARADGLGASGRQAEAIALLEATIRDDPAIVDAHLSLGNLYSSTGRYAEAAASFQRCLELSPDYTLALTNLALAYRGLSRLPDAKLGFERVLELDPANRQALFNLGEIALFEKDYEGALSFFKRGLEEEPESPIFLRQSGVAYFYLADLPRAEKRLVEAMASRSDLESAHYTLALVYEKLARWADAEKAYREEIRLHPDHVRARANLASILGTQGRLDEQIATLEALTERRPELAQAFIQLAKAYRDTNRPELYPRALAAIDRALALEPEASAAPLAYFIRADLLARAGRDEEAREAFERGRALDATAR